MDDVNVVIGNQKRISAPRLFATGMMVGLLVSALTASAQGTGWERREFMPGSVRQVTDLPPGRFRTEFEGLSSMARQRALARLERFHFSDSDLQYLHVDAGGGVYYADAFPLPTGALAEQTDPVIAGAAVPVSPFPAGLIFHSRPGATNVLYLNFCGESVTGTSWNLQVGRDPIPATAFSMDSDFSTFTDAEQLVIRRVWQRVAEDFAPFDVDVTTERPGTLGRNAGMALITRNTDATGAANPSSSSGGVAFVGVFGDSNYDTYRPVWVYHNNLSSVESHIAEAVSHEFGHNLGLSHDGTTDGASYYGGHGSGETSWAPIMGTGYDRNVSQWSKGDYYHSNMTQDDLGIIAGRIPYRTDDHGDDRASASSLVVNAGVIASTTPESDPDNVQPANKGVIDRTSDVDVFVFAAGSGALSLVANPWISPSGKTRGGNLDVLLELRDSNGTLLMTNNSSTATTAQIQTNVSEGVYFLSVRNTGVGNPFSNPPAGYTTYGSLGQYFISGSVVPSSIVIPPQAELQVLDITGTGIGAQTITVTYRDNVGVNVTSISPGDLRVQGPAGYDQLARLADVDKPENGSPRVATYEVGPPSGQEWLAEDNGPYTVSLLAGEVNDLEGASVPQAVIGQFTVLVPRVLYAHHLDVNPGWTLEPDWEYGTPNYSSGGPEGGATGVNILGYNLDGNYGNSLPMRYATTPVVDCSGVGELSVRFHRWLGLRQGDTATIEVSTNGVDWTAVWSTSASTVDTAWVEMQHGLPAWVGGSPTVQLRWGLGSNVSNNRIGWNLDDVAIVSGVPVDAIPPRATLWVPDVTAASQLPYQFTVTYSDETGVAVETLDSTDILILGPKGYLDSADFVGVDHPSDGTPRVATYSAPLPQDGNWDVTDNGDYLLMLGEGAVRDASGNSVAETVVGRFSVAIPEVQLAANVNNAAWGSVVPEGGVFAAGAVVEVTANPQDHFEFDSWTGDVVGTNNPLTLVLSNSISIQANFTEMLTTNYPTPLWWLAEHGFTQDVETVVGSFGANGMPVWQSHIAGLDPNDPASQFRVEIESWSEDAGWVLRWNTVSGRVYSVWQSTNLVGGFLPLPGASNLSWTVQTLTNPVPPELLPRLFRLQVQKP